MSEIETESPPPIEANSRGRPSATTIQHYWEHATKPTQRSIEKAMRADGYDISASTIIRCVHSGFAPRMERAAKPIKVSPALNAVRQTYKVLPPDTSEEAVHPQMVAEALVEAIRNLPAGSQHDRVKTLIDMDDAELQKQTSKLVSVARYLLAEDLAQHTKMMMLAPDKAARLFQVLGNSLTPVNAPPVPPAEPGNGDGARIIEATAQPLSPSALAIQKFRARNAA